MRDLATSLEQILIDRVLSNKASFTGRSKAGFGLLAFSGLLLCLGLGFLLGAAYLWFDKNYTPEVAAAMTGILSMLLALLGAAGAYFFAYFRRRRIQTLKSEIAETVQTALEYADEELGEPVRENPKTAVMIASLAGFVAGERFL